MSKKQLFYFYALTFLFAFIMVAAFYDVAWSARTQFGLPGIYNSTLFNLGDGEGSALSVDSSGRVILSPSSTITIATTSAFTVSSTTFTNGFVSQASSSVRNLNFGKAIFSTPATAVNSNYEIFQANNALYINTPTTLYLTTNGYTPFTLNTDGTITISTTTEVNAADTGVNVLSSNVIVNSRANNAAENTGVTWTASHLSGAHVNSGALIGGKFIAAEIVGGSSFNKITGAFGRTEVDGGTVRQGAAFSGDIVLTGGVMTSGSVFFANPVDNTGGTLSNNYGLLVAPQGTGATSWGLAIDGAGTHSYFEDSLQVGTSTYKNNKASLIAAATSSVGIPLMVRDSNDVNILRVSSNTVFLPPNVLGGGDPSAVSTQVLDVGDNSSKRRGGIVLRTNTDGASPFILMEDASPGRLGGILLPSNLVLTSGGMSSSSLTNNSFDLNLSAGNNKGTFSVDSSGNVSTSGTVNIKNVTGKLNFGQRNVGSPSVSTGYAIVLYDTGNGTFNNTTYGIGLNSNQTWFNGNTNNTYYWYVAGGSIMNLSTAGALAVSSTMTSAGVISTASSTFSSGTTTIANLRVNGAQTWANLPTNVTGNGVCITTENQLTNAGAAACVPSALQFKTEVKPYKESAVKLFRQIVKAGAVNYYKRKDKDEQRKGLIADYVAKVDPTLVQYNQGDVWSLHFEDFTGLAVSAIDELDKKLEAQEKRIAELEKKFNPEVQESLYQQFINWLNSPKK